MKSNLFISVLFILSLTISCSSDDDDDVMNPSNPNTSVTYANSIKSIMDSNCNSCHGNPPTNNAPMSLTSSALVQSAINSRDLIGRVEDGSMPPSGNLSSSQINAIKNWQAGGFK